MTVGPADLVGIYRGAVPGDVASERRSLDDAHAVASVFGAARDALENWLKQIVLSTSTGSGTDEHAIDEGLRRQGGENDATLISRLQTPPKAVTTQSILDAIQPIVDANGGGKIYLIELPRDAAYFSRKFFMGYTNTRMGASRCRMVIALIPASANCLSSCTDALRSKVSAAKDYMVQEYTR